MSAWTIPSYAEWTVPGYTEERPLGHGISGRVVEAVSDATGQRVAIKYLDSNLVEDPSFSWEFRQQVEQLRSLDAAHTVRVFDYAEQPGQGAAIVMELIDGVSLREMITRTGPLGTVAALVTLKDTLLGLAAAHSRRVAHRDVKPENVLVDARGWCTVTDFGVAVKADRHMLVAGTPAYMAPDLWNGSPYVPATDIYAATAVFCESLAGEPPFAGRPSQLRRQHQSAPVPLTQYDQAVQDLIAWGMAKNPAERPHSAREFVHAIEARAAALYGPYWEEDGRRELAGRCAAVRPLLADGGRASATATRMARRKILTVIAAAGAAVIALGTVGVLALARTSTSSSALSSVETVADTAQTTVTPPVAVTRCTAPTTFTYSGTITATIAGEVTYRWAYSTGKQGPVETLNFTAPGHQTVSGGTVSAVTASSGWGEIKLISPATVTSAKASYTLMCGTGDFGLTAAVRPAARTVSSCSAVAPALTASGSVTSKKAQTVSYDWALANGTRSVTRTLAFTAAGTKTVTPFTFVPPALPASGDAVLVVSQPSAAASSPASYSVGCAVPATTPISVPATPVSPVGSVAPVVSVTPAAAKASVSESASLGKSSTPTQAKTSAPPSTKPPTTAPPSTKPPATQPPTTEPPTTQPPATQPPTTEPPATQPPTTQPPTSSGPTASGAAA